MKYSCIRFVWDNGTKSRKGTREWETLTLASVVATLADVELETEGASQGAFATRGSLVTAENVCTVVACGT